MDQLSLDDKEDALSFILPSLTLLLAFPSAASVDVVDGCCDDCGTSSEVLGLSVVSLTLANGALLVKWLTRLETCRGETRPTRAGDTLWK